MKKNLLRISVFAVIAAAAAHAQDVTPLHANVPFDFVVGGQTLHAGQYTLDQGKVGGVVVIAPVDRKGDTSAIGIPIQSAAGHSNAKLRSETKLVFRCYGNACFLSEVWGIGDYGRELVKTDRERELAAQRLVRENTIVAASR
jgi:hypothetical protein